MNFADRIHIAERIHIEACGCHSDVVTGLVTQWCWEHEPRRHTVVPVPRPYDWAKDDDWATT